MPARVPLKPRRRDTGPAPEARNLVLDRDGYACPCCGASVIGRLYTVAYRLRPIEDGDDSPSNLLTLLGSLISPYEDPGNHYGRIESLRDLRDAERGLSLRQGQDPALVPVAYATPSGLALFWLTADGLRSTEPPE